MSTLFATIASALLPIIAILVLYFVKSTLKRIYISIGLTAAFAVAMKLFTDAKKVELFAATAA